MKRLGSIAAVLLVFILSALALIKVYDKGKDQKPLRYADIPPETIDWINSLGNGLNDILSSFNPEPRPAPWNNDGDLGKDPESGLTTLEDDYFIFYFPESMTREAKTCQKYAHQAILRMEDIVGKYYYPDDMNGRKVPIYLTTDQQSFVELMGKIFHGGRDNYDNVGAITIQEISPSGYFLKAIVMNGNSAFRDNSVTKHYLWHEMTHYCHFASIDYNYAISLPMWYYEGLAEYASQPGQRPYFAAGDIETMRNDCNFQDAYFPYVFENYQGGHSIYSFMEKEYKESGLKAFLKTSYTQGIQASIQKHFSKTITEFESDWKANLDMFKR